MIAFILNLVAIFIVLVVLIIGIFTETELSNVKKIILLFIVLTMWTFALASTTKEVQNEPPLPVVPDEIETSITIEQMQKELNRIQNDLEQMQVQLAELMQKEK